MKDVWRRVLSRPYARSGVVLFVLAVLVLVAREPAGIALDRLILQVLTGIMFYQWMLLIARLHGTGSGIRRHYDLHRYMGVAAFLFFALHALGPGYRWTSALVIVFLACGLSGLLNREIIRYARPWQDALWYGLHVLLAAALVPLTALHIWVALAFE